MGSAGGFIDNTLGTNIFGANSTQQAMGAQNAGTQQGNAALTSAYNQQQNYLNPYYQAGTSALSGLSNLSSMSGQDVLNNDPGYQFRLDQGNTAINNAAAARGLGNSGATLKALTQYGQDYASNEYNNAYNRQYNTLNTLAGYGNNAANNLASAAGSYGTNMSNNYTGLGNAQAGAMIAQGQQQANTIGQAASIGAMIFSDERLKTNITVASKEDLAEMKKHLKAYAFNYISNNFGDGDWIGVMAQDLEKSKLGKLLVFEDSKGRKQINQQKLLSLFLATMAEEAA